MHEPQITYVEEKGKTPAIQNFTLLVLFTTYKTNFGKLYEDSCCFTTQDVSNIHLVLPLTGYLTEWEDPTQLRLRIMVAPKPDSS